MYKTFPNLNTSQKEPLEMIKKEKQCEGKIFLAFNLTVKNLQVED